MDIDELIATLIICLGFAVMWVFAMHMKLRGYEKGYKDGVTDTTFQLAEQVMKDVEVE